MAKNDKYQNSEYWEERIANETWKTYNDLEEKNIDLLKMYEKTSRNIKNELLSLAEKAEKEGSLGRTDQYRLNKLLGQHGEIFKECERLGEQIEKHATKGMMDGAKDVYGNVMQSLGNNEFAYPNKKTMEQMLRSPWHGSFFSERLWRDMGKLERNLNGVVNDGIATGKTITEMAVQLSNIMQQSFNATHRLVRTETINYLNRSAKLGYEKAGIKKVQWWAAKDERTCEICGANHEKEYDIDKAPNLPCHPGCRCTWLPVIDYSYSKLGSGKSNTNNDPEGKYVETIDIKYVDNFIKVYENEIENELIEHSYIIQKNGKVYHYIGNKESVSFEGIDLSGATVTHNHPIIAGIDTNSFEDDDFWFLKHHGLEIDKLRATYGDIRYEVKVLQDLSDIDYDSYKYGNIGTALMHGEIEGDLHELIFKQMDKEGLIKYVKYKEKK